MQFLTRKPEPTYLLIRVSPQNKIDADPARATRHTPKTAKARGGAQRPSNSQKLPAKVSAKYDSRSTGCHNFPLSNFKYYLTLFSKFFSSFAHATCSLSVSRQYLALDEIYHPFCAAIPSYTTRRTNIVRGDLLVMDGIFTLYDAPFQGTCTWVTRRPFVYRLQLRGP